MTFLNQTGLIFGLVCFLCLFSGCLGKIVGNLPSNSGNPLPIAPPPVDRSEEEKQKEVEQNTETEKAPEPDDPKEFNYFPYDLQVDTISFLSCNTNQYWNIQAGAYFSRSGLRLSEYFLDKMSSMNADSMESLIKSSTKQRAIPYLTMRYKNNLLQYIKPIVAFNGGIVLPNLIPKLVQNNKTRLREYNGDPISANIVQSNYAHPSSSLRPMLERQLVLALSYTDPKNKIMLHKTGGVNGKDIYGRTYTLGFTDLDMLPNDSADRYALTSVVEKKLPQGLAQTEWVCPASLRLQIRRHPTNTYKAREWYNERVRRDRAYKELYPNLERALNANDPNHRILPSEPTCEDSNSGGATLNVAKAVLENRWNINIERKCISPKNSQVPCYHTSPPLLNRLDDRVELRSNSDCSVRYDGNSIKKQCPRFLSICVRKN